MLGADQFCGLIVLSTGNLRDKGNIGDVFSCVDRRGVEEGRREMRRREEGRREDGDAGGGRGQKKVGFRTLCFSDLSLSNACLYKYVLCAEHSLPLPILLYCPLLKTTLSPSSLSL